jgi:hypothetical protein
VIGRPHVSSAFLGERRMTAFGRKLPFNFDDLDQIERPLWVKAVIQIWRRKLRQSFAW